MIKQPTPVYVTANGRRAFLGKMLMVAGCAATVSACHVSTINGVTTITIDLDKVVAYGTAGINTVTTVLSIAAVASAIGAPAVAALNIAAAATEAALAALKNKAGSEVTLTYDSNGFKSQIDSVLADIQTIASELNSALSGVSGVVDVPHLSAVNTAASALNTVISVFEAVLGVSNTKSAAPSMTIEQALTVLNVSVPA